VEALARPIAAPYRLVDACGQHHLRRDLAHALGQPDLAPLDTQPLLYALRVNGMRQPIRSLQLVDDDIAAPAVVTVADRLAVEPDP